jgi:REP element-mobilizing transposase RayT
MSAERVCILQHGDRDIVLIKRCYNLLEVKIVSRKPRAKSSSGIYHIILHGINRQSIFEDAEDRLKIIEVLAKYKEISQYRIFAYCLMDNHVHILLQEIQESIGMIIQRVSSSYVIWYNGKHERCGHLFQERFKSEVVETDSYFLTVLRYIHQNPVKAKIVNDVADYQWSSYSEYTKKREIVDTEYALHMFSDKPDEAVSHFQQFSRETNGDACLEVPKIKVNVSDDDLRQLVRQQFGIDTMKICNEMREKQNDILRVLKEVDGTNIRQIARITGLSSTRVWKA